MRSIGDRPEGRRLGALIVLLWRAGLRISEARSVYQGDLDRSRGAVLVRREKGGKGREVGMDRSGWVGLDRSGWDERGAVAGCVSNAEAVSRNRSHRGCCSS